MERSRPTAYSSIRSSIAWLSNSSWIALEPTTTMVAKEAYHPTLSNTSLPPEVSAPRLPIHTRPLTKTALSNHQHSLSRSSVAQSTSPKETKTLSELLFSNTDQSPSLSRSLMASATTPVESTPQLSARTPPATSTMPSSSLASESKTASSTGSSRTPGAPTGATTASSRSREA